MKKKRVKRELRALAERQAELEAAQRRLAIHAEVIALAVHSRDRVPERDLEEAIASLSALSEHEEEKHPIRAA